MSHFVVVNVESLFGDDEWDRIKADSRSRARYHCSTCGRFVKNASVVVTPHWEYGYGPEQDETGECAQCGPDVWVNWRE